MLEIFPTKVRSEISSLSKDGNSISFRKARPLEGCFKRLPDCGQEPGMKMDNWYGQVGTIFPRCYWVCPYWVNGSLKRKRLIFPIQFKAGTIRIDFEVQLMFSTLARYLILTTWPASKLIFKLKEPCPPFWTGWAQTIGQEWDIGGTGVRQGETLLSLGLRPPSPKRTARILL